MALAPHVSEMVNNSIPDDQIEFEFEFEFEFDLILDGLERVRDTQTNQAVSRKRAARR